MPPFEWFSHYLAYGATDQETFRGLIDSYNGILVPATIAAYQRQGTGGFVLSLSATEQAPPYMIDPRFPLFQQALTKPKKSHTALAGLLGDPGLVQTHEPLPELYSDERIADIAGKWVEFNVGYVSKETQKFDKYAKRLKEPLAMPDKAQSPELILPPYFACTGVDDPWWLKSVTFFEKTCQLVTDVDCVRVVCARNSAALDPLLASVQGAEKLVIWISGLDEHRAARHDLITYRDAVVRAVAREEQVFALYGGFFSVLLGMFGLSGASHGVGYSEHREWRELPEAGAPPARFYFGRAHRYIAQDVAQTFYELNPERNACPCPHCNARPPVALDYHDLMKHSVWCRATEINEWCDLEPSVAARQLSDEYRTLGQEIEAGALAPRIRLRAESSIAHMLEWVAALQG